MYGHRISSRLHHVLGGCFLALACTQVSAYTGGVTTYRNSPTSTGTVERAVTSPAKTPELDQTYQRTMRKAQTAAAAGRAVGGILRTISGIGTIIAVATLVSDVAGIWAVDASGNNVLTVPGTSSSCSVAPCFAYYVDYPGRDPSFSASSQTSACAVLAVNGATTRYRVMNDNDVCEVTPSTGIYAGERWRIYGTSVAPSPPSTERKTLAQAELEDLLKGSVRLPEVLKELDDKGHPIPWLGEEIEDMPAPLVLMPRTTTNPDGSKIIEQTTLTPVRGPDGKTINWERTTTTRRISAPDAAGNTTTATTTDTSNGGPAEPPRDDRAECEKSPDTLGCADLDTPSETLPKETKNVTFSLESISWGASASCPPNWPISIPMVNRSFSMSYEPFCDVATRIKPFILAGAAFVAMLIVMAGIKS